MTVRFDWSKETSALLTVIVPLFMQLVKPDDDRTLPASTQKGKDPKRRTRERYLVSKEKLRISISVSPVG